jgi:hypothetical protein
MVHETNDLWRFGVYFGANLESSAMESEIVQVRSAIAFAWR